MMRFMICLQALLLAACAGFLPAGGATGDYVVVAEISQVPESDPFGIHDVRIENDSLKLSARYGGGCRDHTFTLYAARAPHASNTVFLHVQHNANNDPCRAWIENHPVAFDLRGLKRDLRINGTATLRSAPGAESVFVLTW